MNPWLVSVILLAMGTVSISQLLPEKLICEYASNPLGVDVANPVLSWQDSATDPHLRGVRQSAYEIIAASSEARLDASDGDLWSTGKIFSPVNRRVPYRGRDLTTAQRVYWKVRIWDQNGAVSHWSPSAEWTMGVVGPTDWKSSWIGAAPMQHVPEDNLSLSSVGTNHPALAESDSTLLRRDLNVRRGLTRAVSFVCGLGQYEMTVNSRKVGVDVLSPGWTKYDKTCLYDTRDITTFLHSGHNAIGLLLGNGMYNVHGGRYTKFEGSFGRQKAICQIELFFADGGRETICTDSTWKVAAGPITFDSPYGGEDYDARLAPSGWDSAGFDDHLWRNADIVEGPGGVLKGITCAAPPIVVVENKLPVSSARLSSTLTVYELGQNASYLPKLTVSGSAGSTVTITPAELLNVDGTVDRESVGGGEAYWKYTLAGAGVESCTPKFFYSGCRYLQVQLSSPGNQPLPTVHSIVGQVITSASSDIGSFHCSNDLFNKTYSLIKWAQRSNAVSVLTDCPHRERLGWLEQAHLNGPAIRYNFDLDQLFGKIESDISDSQTSDGLVPDIAPEYTVFSDGFRDSPEWGSAILLIPWQQYQFSGDSTLLVRYYPQMKAYVDYLSSKANNHMLNYGLGDWYDIGPNPPGFSQLTPPALTATAFFYQDALILSEAARMAGNSADQKRYKNLADQIKVSFNSTFWNTSTLCYSTGSQTANSVPLVLGLVPDERRVEVADALVADIIRHKYSITAGDIGYRYLLRALSEIGRSDLIFKMNNQSDRPGYGYQIKMGATSLTEAWDARRSSSQNHFMLGQINEWFIHDLAGIQDDPASPGYSHIIIRPTPVGDITEVTASYVSDKGLIRSEWKDSAGHFQLNVSIPPNTSAVVYVPAEDKSEITESGRPVERAQDVVNLGFTDGYAAYRVGSGQFSFRSIFSIFSPLLSRQ